MWVLILAVLGVLVSNRAVGAEDARKTQTESTDPVVARLLHHAGLQGEVAVQVVDRADLPADLWSRVQHLVAFRIHRHSVEGTTTVDPAIYLVRTSELYVKAAATLRGRLTTREYVWCLFAAVFSHEAAHTAPLTERQALAAELAQLRRCLLAGHLHASDGWSAASYVGKVQAKLRSPREHY